MKVKRFLDTLFVLIILMNLTFMLSMYALGWKGLFLLPLWIGGYVVGSQFLAFKIIPHLSLPDPRTSTVARDVCFLCKNKDGVMFCNTDDHWVHLDCHDPDNIGEANEQFGKDRHVH